MGVHEGLTTLEEVKGDLSPLVIGKLRLIDCADRGGGCDFNGLTRVL
jgi:hypothetical protein